jgi:flagellar motor switch protein FliN/FliY
MAQESAAKSLPDHPEGIAQSLEDLAAAFAAKPDVGDRPSQGAAADPAHSSNMELIMRIPVTVQIVLGTATMPVANLAKLGRGAVVPLDRRVGEPVDVVVNGKVVARGEVVVTDEDNSRFGISLTEVLGNPGF